MGFKRSWGFTRVHIRKNSDVDGVSLLQQHKYQLTENSTTNRLWHLTSWKLLELIIFIKNHACGQIAAVELPRSLDNIWTFISRLSIKYTVLKFYKIKSQACGNWATSPGHCDHLYYSLFVCHGKHSGASLPKLRATLKRHGLERFREMKVGIQSTSHLIRSSRFKFFFSHLL